MKRTIETTYAPHTDMTFILEHIETDEGEPIQTSVVGWHYGEPYEYSNNFIGKLTATYDY